MKTSTIHVRINAELKLSAEKIINRLGLTPSQAVQVFYAQITEQKGIPFPLRLPNKKTKQAIIEARSSKKLKKYNSTDDMLKDIGI